MMSGAGLLDQDAAAGRLMIGSSPQRRDGFQRHVAGALDCPLIVLFEEQRASRYRRRHPAGVPQPVSKGPNPEQN